MVEPNYDSNNTFASYNEILRTLKNGDALIDDREYYLYRMISEYYGAKARSTNKSITRI